MKDQISSRDRCIKFPTKYTDIVYRDTEYTGTWGKQNTKYTLRGQQSMSTNTGIVQTQWALSLAKLLAVSMSGSHGSHDTGDTIFDGIPQKEE